MHRRTRTLGILLLAITPLVSAGVASADVWLYPPVSMAGWQNALSGTWEVVNPTPVRCQWGDMNIGATLNGASATQQVACPEGGQLWTYSIAATDATHFRFFQVTPTGVGSLEIDAQYEHSLRVDGWDTCILKATWKSGKASGWLQFDKRTPDCD
jgi:hypothetical protein